MVRSIIQRALVFAQAALEHTLPQRGVAGGQQVGQRAHIGAVERHCGAGEHAQCNFVADPDDARAVEYQEGIVHGIDDFFSGELWGDGDEPITANRPVSQQDATQHRQIAERIERHAEGGEVVDRTEGGDGQRGKQPLVARPNGPWESVAVAGPVHIETDRHDQHKKADENRAQPVVDRIVAPAVEPYSGKKSVGQKERKREADRQLPDQPDAPAQFGVRL